MKIFYDVDTQHDFMDKDGALYVPDAENIKHNLALLTNFARKNRIPVLGSVDKHFGTEEYKRREGELARWGGPFPDHCMDRTEGELKILQTTFDIDAGRKANDALTQRYDDEGIYVPHLNTLTFDKVDDIYAISGFVGKCIRFQREFREGRTEFPVYFEKQNYDVFTNPEVELSLENIGVKEAVVYGVATDYCVKAAVLGMQERGIQTYVVEDAIKGVFVESTKSALEEMVNAGAKFVKTREVLEGKIW